LYQCRGLSQRLYCIALTVLPALLVLPGWNTGLWQALASEADSVERATQRVFQELRALEADMLHTLSEQTSTDKSCGKMAADIRALRAAAELEELHIAEVQNELARVAVDCLNTEGHNERLQQALVMLDAQLKEKVGAHD